MNDSRKENVSAEWTIPGAEGETIRGQSHWTRETPRGIVFIAHGFKGYKDYGFIPILASRLAKALPVVVHRFNFSHSGMSDDASTFGRPDLFEKDSYNKQVADLDALLEAAHRGDLPQSGPDAPIFLIGHSRGGVACMLAAGRRFRDNTQPLPCGLVTLAAPSTPNPFTEQERSQLLEQGSLEVVSARTGQTLRVGSQFLQEQLDEPGEFDLASLCAHIDCPSLVLHGAEDPTAPPEAADALGEYMENALVLTIDGADHIFNTPNPADPQATLSEPLTTVVEETSALIGATLDQLAQI